MKITTKIICIAVCMVILPAAPCLAKRTMIPVTGKVHSFGAYSFVGKLDLNITKPGEQNLGKLTVEGTYNGEYPWIMRIYTDNTNYTGLAGSANPRNKGPAGLVSTDGRFAVPLFVNTPNTGISKYARVPDINEPGYKSYRPAKLKLPSKHTECIIMGIDPRNEVWVSGENGILFDDDDNPLGDMTVKTPFDINFKADFDAKAPAANYTANLYIEIVPCP